MKNLNEKVKSYLQPDSEWLSLSDHVDMLGIGDIITLKSAYLDNDTGSKFIALSFNGNSRNYTGFYPHVTVGVRAMPVSILDPRQVMLVKLSGKIDKLEWEREFAIMNDILNSYIEMVNIPPISLSKGGSVIAVEDFPPVDEFEVECNRLEKYLSDNS